MSKINCFALLFVSVAISCAMDTIPNEENVESQVATPKIKTYSANETINSKFEVPNDWDEIVIKKDVTLKGNFFIPSSRNKDLTIRGEDWNTSTIEGNGNHQKNKDYIGIRSEMKTNTVTVKNLKSLNPRHYHILGDGRMVLDKVKIIDDRNAGDNNSDGFGGGDGSEIRNCYIDTMDDSIKVYNKDFVIKNTTIIHNSNGAPLQMGWSGQNEGSATIDGLTIVANAKTYNQGVFSWAGNSEKNNKRTFTITGDGILRKTNKNQTAAPMFQFGSNQGGTVKNATITMNGYCKGERDITQKNNSSGNVEFKGCQ